MTPERLAELVKAFAGPRGVKAHALPLSCVVRGAHYGLLPGPSKSINRESWNVLELSSEFVGGRSTRCQPPSSLFFSTQISFCDCASVTRSWTVSPPEPGLVTVAWPADPSGAVMTSRLRRRTRLTTA